MMVADASLGAEAEHFDNVCGASDPSMLHHSTSEPRDEACCENPAVLHSLKERVLWLSLVSVDFMVRHSFNTYSNLLSNTAAVVADRFPSCSNA